MQPYTQPGSRHVGGHDGLLHTRVIVTVVQGFKNGEAYTDTPAVIARGGTRVVRCSDRCTSGQQHHEKWDKSRFPHAIPPDVHSKHVYLYDCRYCCVLIVNVGDCRESKLISVQFVIVTGSVPEET